MWWTCPALLGQRRGDDAGRWTKRGYPDSEHRRDIFGEDHYPGGQDQGVQMQVDQWEWAVGLSEQ